MYPSHIASTTDDRSRGSGGGANLMRRRRCVAACSTCTRAGRRTDRPCLAVDVAAVQSWEVAHAFAPLGRAAVLREHAESVAQLAARGAPAGGRRSDGGRLSDGEGFERSGGARREARAAAALDGVRGLAAALTRAHAQPRRGAQPRACRGGAGQAGRRRARRALRAHVVERRRRAV